MGFNSAFEGFMMMMMMMMIIIIIKDKFTHPFGSNFSLYFNKCFFNT